MPAAKPTISLDPDLRDAIADAADAEGVSFSAWIANAARRRLSRQAWEDYFVDWQAEHGSFTFAERNAARAALGLPLLADPRHDEAQSLLADAMQATPGPKIATRRQTGRSRKAS